MRMILSGPLTEAGNCTLTEFVTLSALPLYLIDCNFSNSISNCCFQHNVSAFDTSHKSRTLPKCLRISDHCTLSALLQIPSLSPASCSLCDRVWAPLITHLPQMTAEESRAERSRSARPVDSLTGPCYWYICLKIVPKDKC